MMMLLFMYVLCMDEQLFILNRKEDTVYKTMTNSSHWKKYLSTSNMYTVNLFY